MTAGTDAADLDDSEVWIEYVAIDDLVPDEDNPKGHDLDTIGDSFKRFGYTVPIIVDDRTGKMLAGHGRRDELIEQRDAGEPLPRRCRLDEHGRWLVPVVRGISMPDDDEARAYLVTDNRLTERGGWLVDRLAPILADLRDGPGLHGVGYDSTEVDDMLAGLKPPSLDELEQRYGDVSESQLWPVLRFKVPPSSRDRYLALVNGIEGGDDVLFAHLLDLAERAPPMGSTPRCTDLVAAWCPIHGTCCCPTREDGERMMKRADEVGCPLHAKPSMHAS